MKNLFGEDLTTPKKKGRQAKLNDYDNFVEKFKPKKTTDDCYTPAPVYEAVCRWVSGNIMPLNGVEIVRPFFPGGDFERYDYPEGCIVLDNPPFSILAKIRRFYHLKGIKYFLFAPALTIENSAKELDDTYLVCGAPITYENGAVVPTSFVTNLPCGDIRVWCAGSLNKIIEQADEENRQANRVEQPAYEYPPQVISPAILQKISKRGIDLRIPKNECASVSVLDSQRSKGKAIYGGGWFISERLAAERLAARNITYWALSDREKQIIKRLNTSN